MALKQLRDKMIFGSKASSPPTGPNSQIDRAGLSYAGASLRAAGASLSGLHSSQRQSLRHESDVSRDMFPIDVTGSIRSGTSTSTSLTAASAGPQSHYQGKGVDVTHLSRQEWDASDAVCWDCSAPGMSHEEFDKKCVVSTQIGALIMNFSKCGRQARGTFDPNQGSGRVTSIDTTTGADTNLTNAANRDSSDGVASGVATTLPGSGSPRLNAYGGRPGLDDKMGNIHGVHSGPGRLVGSVANF